MNHLMRLFIRLSSSLILLCVVAAPAQAAGTFNISGGKCTFIDQANGVRLDRCLNTSGSPANDLHLDISYQRNALPAKTYDIVQPTIDLFCLVTWCFGKEVANGAYWEGQSGSTGEASNITVWNSGNLAELGAAPFAYNKMTVSGYWTKDGVQIVPPPVPIPEPGTLVMLLAGLLALAWRVPQLGSESRADTVGPSR